MKGSRMKAVILNSKTSQQDLYTFNKDLIENLLKNYSATMYDDIRSDFSNIPELFDEEDKLVLVNHFAIEGGFETFSKHLPSFKNIKYILSPYSSYSGLDLDLLKKLNIRYRNNGGANAKSVAQYALTAMLMLLGRFPQLAKLESMPDGSILGDEIDNKTAGIIGMGNVGTALLEILNKLKIPSVYYNRSDKNVNSNRVPIEEVFKQDMVFITVATSPETIELLSKISSYINQNNYIVDVSAHDELYDKNEMIKLLGEGKFLGYGLETDIRSNENLNLITTPHIAWCTYDAEKRTVDNYLNRAISILKGDASNIDFVV